MGNKLAAGSRLLLCGILAFGAVNVAVGGFVDSSAIAAPGGGGGGGGGGGNGNGGQGGNNGNDNGKGNGAAAAAAGALNAAKASPNARANAASKSRVGLIAEFEELARELLGLQAEYNALVDARNTLNDPTAKAQEIAAAEATLRDAGLLGPTDPLSSVDKDDLDDAIDAAENNVATAMGAAATVQQALIDMLEPAANKQPVTNDVVNSVLGWLGISN
jgi:uncharacterized protein YdcH (DUF465 family)